MALYNVSGGPDWSRTDNWLTDEPLNEWYGVTTGENGRVTELNLPTNQRRHAAIGEPGGASEA